MVLFTLQFHSVVDVITNSSSELFVGLENSKELLISLVKDVYPNYLDEYVEIKNTRELSDGDLSAYIYFHYDCWSNRQQRFIHSVIDGFDYDEMYEKKEYDYGNGEVETYIQIREDFVIDNRDRIIESIDPDGKMFFMFSRDENPDWEKQEQLMLIMNRYHLG